MIAPYYRELSETHPSIMFLAIDVDELTVSNATELANLKTSYLLLSS